MCKYSWLDVDVVKMCIKLGIILVFYLSIEQNRENMEQNHFLMFYYYFF